MPRYRSQPSSTDVVRYWRRVTGCDPDPSVVNANLQSCADLHEKEEMLIYDFVADTTQLASGGLHAFEGFFDVSYRKHDYDYGRSMGQQQLAMYQGQQGSVFANLHWIPKPINPINPNLNNLDMSKVDRAKRQQVYTQLCSAANALLQELNVNLIGRKALMLFSSRGKSRKCWRFECSSFQGPQGDSARIPRIEPD